jgi:hypothetical protein
MPQPIIFYDIACDLNTSPSINVTKTRSVTSSLGACLTNMTNGA